MTVDYSRTSPYATTTQNTTYLEHWTPRSIPQLVTDRLITITPEYQYKPHLLANDLYGDVRLWWVFASRNPNDIRDPIYDFTAGLQIFVSEKSALLNILNAQ